MRKLPRTPRKKLALRKYAKKTPRKVSLVGAVDTAWWDARVTQMQQSHDARVKMLREVGEHPSPLFARQVRAFGALGLPKDMGAVILGITESDLEHHYAHDYDIGKGETLIAITSNMLRIATLQDNDSTAARVGMDMLGRRGGNEWRPPAQQVVVEKTFPEENLIDSSKLTREERQQLRTVIEAAIERKKRGEEVPTPEEEPGQDVIPYEE